MEPEAQTLPEPVRAQGVRRWPAVLTVLVAMTASVLLPQRWVLGPTWLAPTVEGLLVAALLAANPRRAGRRYTYARSVSIALVVVLAANAAWTAGRMITELLDGGQQWSNARALLIAGALVWIYTNIAFTFVCWELDGGGAAARAALHPPKYPDLAFPQHLNPDLQPPGWRPDFVDYLYLGFTNATAFSPTDVMPLRHWAKMAMALQAMISIAILTLVIANAVNLLG